jgi:hypothetical protein
MDAVKTIEIIEEFNAVIRLEGNRYEYRGVRFGRDSKKQIIIIIRQPQDTFRGYYSVVAKNLNEAKAIIDTKLASHDVIGYRLCVKAGN